MKTLLLVSNLMPLLGVDVLASTRSGPFGVRLSHNRPTPLLGRGLDRPIAAMVGISGATSTSSSRVRVPASKSGRSSSEGPSTAHLAARAPAPSSRPRSAATLSPRSSDCATPYMPLDAYVRRVPGSSQPALSPALHALGPRRSRYPLHVGLRIGDLPEARANVRNATRRTDSAPG
jgi:hypothetical protein